MHFGHHTASERPTPGCSYVARIAFEYGPHVFKPGDPFDYKVLGLVETQAQELWVAGRLLVGAPLAVAPEPPRKRKVS